MGDLRLAPRPRGAGVGGHVVERLRRSIKALSVEDIR
jgi:hypothetical protein